MIGEHVVSFLLDTGARATLAPSALAEAVGLEDGAGDAREFRGLDGAALPARPVRIDGLSLGGKTLPAVDAYAADIPVLTEYGLDEDTGLLGIDFLPALDPLDIPARKRIDSQLR